MPISTEANLTSIHDSTTQTNRYEIFLIFASDTFLMKQNIKQLIRFIPLQYISLPSSSQITI